MLPAPHYVPHFPELRQGREIPPGQAFITLAAMSRTGQSTVREQLPFAREFCAAF